MQISLITLTAIIGLTAGDNFDCQFYRGTREGIAKPIGICEYDGQVNTGVVESISSTIAECLDGETLNITTYDTMNCNGNVISQNTYKPNKDMEYNCASLFECNYVLMEDHVNSGFPNAQCIDSSTPVSRKAVLPNFCSTKYYRDSGVKMEGSGVCFCKIDTETGRDFMEIYQYAIDNNYCDITQIEDVYDCVYVPRGIEFREQNELLPNYNPADDACIIDDSGTIGERYTVVRCDATESSTECPPASELSTENPPEQYCGSF